MTNWIACTERMPEPNTRVLVYGSTIADPYGPVSVAIYRQWDVDPEPVWVDGADACCDAPDEDPTHWMPLPEPPSP